MEEREGVSAPMQEGQEGQEGQPAARVLRNHTTMTIENMMRATRSQRNLVKGMLAIFMFIFLGAITLSFALDAVKSGDLFDWVLVGIIGAVSVGILLWIALGFDRMVAKNTQKTLGGMIEEIDYSFGTEEFFFRTVFGAGVTADHHIAYTRLLSAVETDEMWVFSIVKNARYALDKSGMSKEDEEELSRRLRSALGTRCFDKRKKKN